MGEPARVKAAFASPTPDRARSSSTLAWLMLQAHQDPATPTHPPQKVEGPAQGGHRMEIHSISIGGTESALQSGMCQALPTCKWQVDSRTRAGSQGPERARAQPRSHSSGGEASPRPLTPSSTLSPLPAFLWAPVQGNKSVPFFRASGGGEEGGSGGKKEEARPLES